jgi:hypothetical protein
MNSCFALLESFQIYHFFLDNFFFSVYIYIYIELSYLVGPHFVFKLTFPSIYHFLLRYKLSFQPFCQEKLYEMHWNFITKKLKVWWHDAILFVYFDIF